jgi:hypothetical protein
MAIADGVWFKLPWWNLRTRFQTTMSDRSNSSKNQPQIDSTKNLLFLLQTLARQAQARASAAKSFLESSSTDKQVEESVRRNRFVM